MAAAGEYWEIIEKGGSQSRDCYHPGGWRSVCLARGYRRLALAKLWRPVDLRLTNSTLYLATATDLIALNASTNHIIWEQAYPDAFTFPSGQFHAHTVFPGEFNGLLAIDLSTDGPSPTDVLAALRTDTGALVWQRKEHLTSAIRSVIPAGQPVPLGGGQAVSLTGSPVYVVSYEGETTVPPSRFITLASANPALTSSFNTTTYTLKALAIDGQTGHTQWQQQHVETFYVA